MKRFTRESFERCRVTGGRPELQFGVARRAELQQVVVAAVVELEPSHGLRVAAVQTLRETEDGRERSHGAPLTAGQVTEPFVPPLRGALAMVARHERNRLDFVRLEAPEVAVLGQIVRVLVMAFVADVHADIVQNRRVFEPLALAIRQAVNCARVVEQRHRQPRH